MTIVELSIDEKKAVKLINFLKDLDFVEVRQVKQKLVNKNLSDILIPSINPNAEIAHLFGAWKNINL